MPRVAYVDGRYRPLSQAAIRVEDRGYQFSEAVYEVVALIDGRMIDADPHLARFVRSAEALRLPPPPPAAAMRMIMTECARRNRVRHGWIYLQWSGGVAPRDFAPKTRPDRGVLVVYARPKPVEPAARKALARGVSAITVGDLRWRRRDIKTVSLLGAAMAKRAAVEAGAVEAIQVEPDGRVTEGASSNVWLLGEDGVLRTPPPSHDLLNGITRRTVLAIAAEQGVRVEESWFDRDALYAAREVFLTSASALLAPIITLDGRPIGGGAPGAIARAVLNRYLEADRPGPQPL